MQLMSRHRSHKTKFQPLPPNKAAAGGSGREGGELCLGLNDGDLRRQGGLSGFFEAGDVDAPGQGCFEETAPEVKDDAGVVLGRAGRKCHR